MHVIRIVIMCAAFAVIGFLGGRWTGSAEAKKEAVTESGEPRGRTGGSRFQRAAEDRPSKSATRTRRPPVRTATGDPTVDLAREMFDSWNDQDIKLPDGSESELLLFDLGKFGRLLNSLDRANEDEIARLRTEILPKDDDSYETDVLKATAGMLIASRDIQLHGSQALDNVVDHAMANPDEAEIEDLMPAMVYTLALQDRAAAEKWLDDVSKRPNVDDFIDLDEMRAALDKSESPR